MVQLLFQESIQSSISQSSVHVAIQTPSKLLKGLVEGASGAPFSKKAMEKEFKQFAEKVNKIIFGVCEVVNRQRGTRLTKLYFQLFDVISHLDDFCIELSGKVRLGQFQSVPWSLRDIPTQFCDIPVTLIFKESSEVMSPYCVQNRRSERHNWSGS